MFPYLVFLGYLFKIYEIEPQNQFKYTKKTKKILWTLQFVQRMEKSLIRIHLLHEKQKTETFLTNKEKDFLQNTFLNFSFPRRMKVTKVHGKVTSVQNHGWNHMSQKNKSNK